MSITSSSVLVEMNISVWTANKLDRKATDDVIANNAAADRAAQVRKNLMAGSNARKKIADFAAQCRLWHNTQTLPWADKGSRILPTSLFLDYKQEANHRRDKFNQMVQEFLTDYPSLVQTASNYLGGLFNADDYPTPESVADKFGFRLVFTPVPEAGDFRLDVPAQDMQELRTQYEDSFRERLADAVREPWNRLHKLLTGMSTKLTEVEGEKGKRYHETFITNAQDMCSMLTHLNINNDPELEKARRSLENALLGVDIESIKESEQVRADVKQRVDSILKKFEW